MSEPRLMRRAREKRRRDLCGGVLGRKLHREALPPLLATPAEYIATPARRHPSTKSVLADSALVARAISGLTHMSYVCETRLTGNATRGRKPIPLTAIVSTP